MDPLTIAASIAAVKTAVKAAKSVQDIGHSLEELWNNQTAHNKKKSSSKMQDTLRQRTGEKDDGDNTSISAVAADIFEAKQNEIALMNLATEIDKKWGRGTWLAIKTERAKRIEEQAETKKVLKAKEQAKEKKSKLFWRKVLVEGGKVVLVLAVIGALVYFLIWAKGLRS